MSYKPWLGEVAFGMGHQIRKLQNNYFPTIGSVLDYPPSWCVLSEGREECSNAKVLLREPGGLHGYRLASSRFGNQEILWVRQGLCRRGCFAEIPENTVVLNPQCGGFANPVNMVADSEPL